MTFTISKYCENHRKIPLIPPVSCGSRERRVVSHLRNDNHKFQPTYSIMGHKRVHQPSPPMLMPHLSLSVSWWLYKSADKCFVNKPAIYLVLSLTLHFPIVHCCTEVQLVAFLPVTGEGLPCDAAAAQHCSD